MFIPNDLSQDSLPLSFRFYDPIIAFAAEGVSEQNISNCANKQALAYHIHYQNDLKLQLMNNLGFIGGENKNLTNRNVSLNKQPPPGVNHHNSMHSMALQRSKYLCIDDDITKEFVLESEYRKRQTLRNRKENSKLTFLRTGKQSINDMILAHCSK